ncbi:dTTP/UTP pyrophosphatase [Labeo rohita]|uniref:dTTP/UTP pyrophosphatase n=1 Tax=Labeo rohita TaxID=84645 RepID=A0ABQ8LT29_LABRO|nr:dTTP/UTP pyrophosphatase [Labeo rohita]
MAACHSYSRRAELCSRRFLTAAHPSRRMETPSLGRTSTCGFWTGCSRPLWPSPGWDSQRCLVVLYLVEQRLSPSTLKVYVAAIATYHNGKHHLNVRFLRGARRQNPPRPHLIPSWDLSVVLAGLTSLLIALNFIKRVEDLHSFSVSDSHVILRPQPGYVPKVPTTPFKIRASDAPSSFVCFRGQQKGNAVSKQRLPHWVVDAITLAYQCQGKLCRLGVRAHFTRNVTSPR